MYLCRVEIKNYEVYSKGFMELFYMFYDFWEKVFVLKYGYFSEFFYVIVCIVIEFDSFI